MSRTVMSRAVYRPTFMVRSIHDLPVEALLDNRILALVFDVDNTLGPIDCTRLSEEVMVQMDHLRARGFRLCLGTNSRRDLSEMARELGAQVVQPGKGIPKKPHPDFFQAALRTMRTSPAATAMIGDKLLFDTSPAASLGLTTILVNPLGKDLVWEALAARRFRERRHLRRFGLQRP